MHRRWFLTSGVRFLDVYSGAMILPCLWGIALFGAGDAFGSSGLAWVLGVPIGLVAGAIAFSMDRRVIRTANRRSFARTARNADRPSMAPGNVSRSLRWSGFTGQIASRKRRVLSFDKPTRTFGQPELQREFRLASVVPVAVLQELIYRGVLIRACFLLAQPALRMSALVGVVLAFALLHVSFGWPQVLAKLPLSVLTTAAVLLLGTVAPALCAHVLFNVRAARDLRTRALMTTAAHGLVSPQRL